jgi:hypothetical protein
MRAIGREAMDLRRLRLFNNNYLGVYYFLRKRIFARKARVLPGSVLLSLQQNFQQGCFMRNRGNEAFRVPKKSPRSAGAEVYTLDG